MCRLRLMAPLFVVWMFVASTDGQEPHDLSEVRQDRNVVYGESHGVGLIMDVFHPLGKPNGRGVVQVVSGAWHSDRGKLRDLKRAQLFSTFCGRGYVVFAIRPGSISKFSGAEMVGHLEQGITWVKSNADHYGIAPDRLGLIGASAGGHLASMIAVRHSAPDDAATIAATVVFFPPTDFLDFGGVALDPHSGTGIGATLRRLALGDADELSEEDIVTRITDISPARLVTRGMSPFLLIHGDADRVVPLQQSEKLVAALQEHDVPVRLVVKEGGGHPWPTIHEEVRIAADWLDEQLR